MSNDTIGLAVISGVIIGGAVLGSFVSSPSKPSPPTWVEVCARSEVQIQPRRRGDIQHVPTPVQVCVERGFVCKVDPRWEGPQHCETGHDY